MFSGGSRKPYTAITVQIDRLTAETYEEHDLSGIVDLIEVIRLQDSGPTEAARAIRKKLKYGNVHRQLRALTVLDGLIQNAGIRFQRTFADEPLLERLRVMATDPVTDPDVKAKCKTLFGQWMTSYKGQPGMGGIANLYTQLPKKKRPAPVKEPVPKPPSPELRRPSVNTAASSASASSSRWSAFSSSNNTPKSKSKPDKNANAKPFNLEKEKPQLMQTLANASVASTNLLNALRRINREKERVSDNAECSKHFETCKTLRKAVLRYIQNVESEQWLGSLIHANEELVNALRNYEILDKSVEDDSDSDIEEGTNTHTVSPGSSPRGAASALAGLSLNTSASPPPKPPRPTSISLPPNTLNNGKAKQQEESEPEDEDEDEDDPFADRNAVQTPHIEKEIRWKEI